jgi:3-isopropylmalate/(R)-2-methylmalate dehydratase small subunit
VTPAHGRCWVFPDANINTDQIRPTPSLRLPLPEQALHVFAAIRPGWAALVQTGDILIGGKNFGTGSSRPASQVLVQLGIRALVAESINGLFFRNCVNYALPAIEIPGILDLVSEGDILDVDAARGTMRNERTGQSAQGAVMPPLLLEILESGGLINRLQAQGYI